MTSMVRTAALAAGLLAALTGATQAQDTAVSIGISGWTGFAPLTLAKEAGIFKKNGLDEFGPLPTKMSDGKFPKFKR